MKKCYLLLILFAVLVSCNQDSDGDNVNDKVDKCPDTFGLVEFNGCPDSDEDGIPDPDDNCPDEYGLEEFDGCPDADEDGIPDDEDDCPEEYGYERYNGCPNNDNIKLLVLECLKSNNVTDEEINEILIDGDLTLNTTINYKICNSLLNLVKKSRLYKQRMKGFEDEEKELNKRKSAVDNRAKEINDGYIQAVYNQGNGAQYVVILKGSTNNPTFYLMQVLHGGKCPIGGTAKFDETTFEAQQIWVRHKPHKVEATLFTMRLLDSSKQPFDLEKIY